MMNQIILPQGTGTLVTPMQTQECKPYFLRQPKSKTMKSYKDFSERFTIVKEPTTINRVKITTAEDLETYSRQLWDNTLDIFESFYVILLNRAHRTIGFTKISQGGTYGTVVDVKLIALYALESLASSVALVHNHPSGNTNPSTQDISITKKIQTAMKLLDVNVLDHIILTTDGYYSMANEGVI